MPVLPVCAHPTCLMSLTACCTCRRLPRFVPHAAVIVRLPALPHIWWCTYARKPVPAVARFASLRAARPCVQVGTTHARALRVLLRPSLRFYAEHPWTCMQVGTRFTFATLDLLLQHPDETHATFIWNIHMKRMKHTTPANENTCNMKHLLHLTCETGVKGSNRPRGGWIGGSKKNLKLKNSTRKLIHWPVLPVGLDRYYRRGITGTTDADHRHYRYPTETKKSEICELWFQIWVLLHYQRWCWWSLWTLLSCSFTK
jgi:hypothetical protein